MYCFQCLKSDHSIITTFISCLHHHTKLLFAIGSWIARHLANTRIEAVMTNICPLIFLNLILYTIIIASIISVTPSLLTKKRGSGGTLIWPLKRMSNLQQWRNNKALQKTKKGEEIYLASIANI